MSAIDLVLLTLIPLALLAVLVWGLWRVFYADVRDAEVAEGRESTPATQHVHIAGYFESVWSAVRGRAPRALCGTSLEARPGEAELGADAPTCPDCLIRSGGRS